MKNDYITYKDHVVITIKRRNGDLHQVKVCHEGFEKLKQHKHKWHVWYNRNNDSFYVMSTIYKGLDEEGKPIQEMVYMHRYLTGAVKGDYIDHINHDTLDNRLSNLRITTNSDNLYNRKGANKNSTTGIRNVNYSTREKKYIVQFCREGRRINLGMFEDLEEAKRVAEDFRNWA